MVSVVFLNCLRLVLLHLVFLADWREPDFVVLAYVILNWAVCVVEHHVEAGLRNSVAGNAGVVASSSGILICHIDFIASANDRSDVDLALLAATNLVPQVFHLPSDVRDFAVDIILGRHQRLRAPMAITTILNLIILHSQRRNLVFVYRDELLDLGSDLFVVKEQELIRSELVRPRVGIAVDLLAILPN